MKEGKDRSGISDGKEHISLCSAEWPPRSSRHHTWAHHAPPWWLEKFYAFLLLQKFLPGIQSHRSNCRKQVTSPQLSPELGCLNFPECGLRATDALGRAEVWTERWDSPVWVKSKD